MRVLGLLVLGIALCGNAMALETSAGADTVNSSQVGIDAKIEATNAITTSSINSIFNCGKNGQLYDSMHNVCIDVAEPLAKKIAACTTSKQFYNQATGACMASAPDLTTNLNTTNSNLNSATSLLNAVLNCNRAHMFYNSATGACEGGAGVSSMVMEQCNDGGKGSGSCTTPACPAGYFLSGCGYGPGASAYVSFGPANASQCWCGKSHGAGKLTCTSFCVK
jgi:hypothetical protein